MTIAAVEVAHVAEAHNLPVTSHGVHALHVHLPAADRRRTIRNRAVALFLSAMLLALGAPAPAQEPPRLPRIGVLIALPPAAISTRIEGFRQRLKELGYVEGKNILLEYRSAEGQLDRLPALAAELARLRVDVIVTGGPQATGPARNATATIPIVMAQDSSPVEAGFVASLARPGGNVTGLANLHPELSGKQLELLKEIVPRLSRVAVLGYSTEPGNAQAWSGAERAAGSLGLTLQYLDVRGAGDIEPAFQAAKKERAGAVLVLASPLSVSHRARFADLAARGRLPAMHQIAEFPEAGGLVTYGVNVVDLWRRAATYVDRILKGARPADLPVEQPTRFELIFNLRAARQIGLTIPPHVLARADRVIN